MTDDQLDLEVPDGKKPLDERALLNRLRKKHDAEQSQGNGSAWAFIEHVRSVAGFDARTIDAFAMHLWPSRGLQIHAFECKSSRSDLLRELKNPAKGEAFAVLADYFWLVLGDRKIIKPGELPDGWGLMVPHGKGLRVEVPAPRLREVTKVIADLPPGVGRPFVAALLRSAVYEGARKPEDIAEAERRGRDAGKAEYEYLRDFVQGELDRERADRKAFEDAAGITLRTRWPDHDPAEVGAAVRMVLDGQHEITTAQRQLASLRRTAEGVIANVDRALGPPAP